MTQILVIDKTLAHSVGGNTTNLFNQAGVLKHSSSPTKALDFLKSIVHSYGKGANKKYYFVR